MKYGVVWSLTFFQELPSGLICLVLLTTTFDSSSLFLDEIFCNEFEKVEPN